MINDRYDLLTATTPIPRDSHGALDLASAVFDASSGPPIELYRWSPIAFRCLQAAVLHETAVHPNATLSDLAHTINSRPLSELRVMWSASPSRAARAYIPENTGDAQSRRNWNDIESQLRRATSPYLNPSVSLTRHHHIIPTRFFQFSFEASCTDELTAAIERGVGMMIGECGPPGRAYVGIGLHPSKIITVLERVTGTGWRLWGGTIATTMADTDWDTLSAIHARARDTLARVSSEWTETNLYVRWVGQARDLDAPAP